MARVIQTPSFGGAPRRITSILGSGTYVVPDDISVIKVIVTGGGGGGGSHNTDDAQGGGGAGGTSIKIINVIPGTQYYCTIGGGGSASVGNTNGGGGTGGSSSFGSECSATGGTGTPQWAIGGRGGVGSGGNLNLYGSDGHCGNIDGGGNEESGGNGGDSYWNGAGTGGSTWGARRTARGWGCGGSGAHAGTTNDGTPGMQGAVVIEEYQ
jgi:hypothetical protein